MGNSQASAFHSQFSSMELKESTKKQLWNVYFCTSASSESQKMATSDAADGSPPGSPRRSGNGLVADGGNKQQPPGKPLLLLQLNTSHPSFKASLSPPKALNPDHHNPSSYRLQYRMLDTAFHALKWLKENPHRALPRVTYVDFLRDESLLYATLPYVSMDPAILRLPTMTASEILYGLTKVAEALAHLHSHGLAHRNVSWRTVYLVNANLSAGDCTWKSTDLTWILGDVQFIARGDGLPSQDVEAIKDYFAEIRGARLDPSVSSYVAPEINNPYSATQLDWAKVPVGAADVFSFGVMLEKVLNTEKATGRVSSAPYVNPFAQPHVNGPKAATAALLSFARSCQCEDPLKRPPIEAFFDLAPVQASTYVSVMQELDHYRSSGPQRRLHFFYLLHAELLKIPYDLMLTRVIPRLLKSSIWSEPVAECFIRQLLHPLPSKYTQGAAVIATSDSLGNNDMLQVPLDSTAQEVLKAFVVPPKRLADDGTEDEQRIASSTATEGSGDAVAPVSIPVPWMDKPGLLALEDYATLIAPFLKHTIDSVVRPRSASDPSPDPQLLCVLLRNAEVYAPFLSFSQFVAPSLLPFVSHCLRHPSNVVAVEAVGTFAYLQKFMFQALYRVRQSLSSAVPSADDKKHTTGVSPAISDPKRDRSQVLEQALQKGIAALVIVLHTDVVSLAAGDADSAVRLAALSLLTKQLFILRRGTTTTDSEILSICRTTALAGLCANVVLLSLPTSAANTSDLYSKAAHETLSVVSRALLFVQKIVSKLSPSEISRDIVPALAQLIERCRMRPDAPPATGLQQLKWVAAVGSSMQVLHDTAVDVLEQCFQRLAEAEAASEDTGGGHHADEGEALSSDGERGSEDDSASLDDDEDDDDPSHGHRSGSDAEERNPAPNKQKKRTTASRHIRAAVTDGDDGWCTVRDPTPFVCRCLEWARKHIHPRAAEAPLKEQGGQHSQQVGSRLSLPPAVIAKLPTYSFTDVEYEYNQASILKPDIVAADIILAASSVRTFFINSKPHVFACRLPSRRPPNSVVSSSTESTATPSSPSGTIVRQKKPKRPIASVDAIDQPSSTVETPAAPDEPSDNHLLDSHAETANSVRHDGTQEPEACASSASTDTPAAAAAVGDDTIGAATAEGCADGAVGNVDVERDHDLALSNSVSEVAAAASLYPGRGGGRPSKAAAAAAVPRRRGKSGAGTSIGNNGSFSAVQGDDSSKFVPISADDL